MLSRVGFFYRMAFRFFSSQLLAAELWFALPVGFKSEASNCLLVSVEFAAPVNRRSITSEMITKPSRLVETFGVAVAPVRSSCRDPLGSHDVTNPSASKIPGCNPPPEKARNKSPATWNATYRALPGFGDVPRSDQQALFVKKLDQCCVVFDFTKPTKNAKEKKVKRQALEELVDYVTTSTKKFPEVVMEVVIKMVSVNLFRVPHFVRKKRTSEEGFDFEDEEHYMDPSWPHLELVYRLLLVLLESRELDTRMAMKFVDCSFILRLLDLFDSEDPRERECLESVLLRIYCKFTKLRPFVSKAIENMLCQLIYGTEKHNGIAELLEILGSIITGYVVPLKEEHKIFLARVLIPLHKTSCVKMCHEQLCYCITQFIEKDVRLAGTVVRGLLKYWPITDSSKQVIFLQELEEVLEATSSVEFDRCMIPLSRQFARCLNNSHYQVAQRVLFLWRNYHIERLMEQNMGAILPILYPSLERNAREHWNKTIQKLSQNVLQSFSNHNQELFEKCTRMVEEDKAKKEGEKSRHNATWQRLEEIAASRALRSEIPASQPV